MASADHTIYYTAAYAHGTHKTTYNKAQINAAIGHALDLLKDGEQVGDAKYPRVYKKFHLGQTHAHEPVFEFPILQDSLYDGSVSPGPDRVVFGSVSKDYKTADYIGVAGVSSAAPEGVDRPARIFPDTSVNQDLTTSQKFDTKGQELHDAKDTVLPPDSRDLISNGDVKIAFSE